MEYARLIKERYSVRKFSEQPVDDAKLAAILGAGRLSPTAVNKQPYRILVLRGAENMKKLETCTPYTFGAPLALAVCAKADEAWVRPYDNQNSCFIDAAIVGTHLMLAIHDQGLGSTWVGHFDPAAFRAVFKLPDDLEPVALFPVGHLAADARPASLHGKRRSLDETVVYLD